MNWSICLFVVIFLFGTSCVSADSGDSILARTTREPLHGITRVVITDVTADPGIINDGLDIDAIKTSLENKLMIAGLKIEPISTMSEPFETRPQCISINIEALKIRDTSMYCYNIRYQVMNYAVLVQDKQVSKGFTVWEEHVLGYTDTSRLSVIKDDCDNFTDKFINDWLKAKDEIPGDYSNVQN
jgi:hypothetical protein